jgi:hypothetical protein
VQLPELKINKERRLYSLPSWMKYAKYFRKSSSVSSSLTHLPETPLSRCASAPPETSPDMSEQIQQRDMHMREFEAALEATQATLVQTQVKKMNGREHVSSERRENADLKSVKRSYIPGDLTGRDS